MVAKKTSEEQKTGARLGSLLLLAELVSEEQMSQTMETASKLSLPLGRAFVMLGILDNSVIIAAVEMQSLLRDKLVDIETIKSALQLVKKEGLSTGAALSKCGWVPKEDSVFTKLGDLLLEAGIINNEQLKEALSIAKKAQMPLGRVLSINDFVKESLLWSALNAQVLIRDGRINRKQAIAGLKAAHTRQRTLEHSLMEQGVPIHSGPKKIKLGDMLIMAGLLSQEDLLNTLEACLLTDKPMGHVLIQKGLLSQEAIDSALAVQELVTSEKVPPYAAGELLKQVVRNNRPLDQCVAELSSLQAPQENTRLGELFKRAGLISDEEINEALKLTLSNSSLLGKILVATGHVEEGTLNEGLRCQFLLRKGLLTEEKAIVALSYCQRMRCSFDEALIDLGYTKDSRSK